MSSRVASYCRKAFKKLFQRIVVFEVLEQGFYRYASSFENGYTAKNVWVDCDEVGGVHVGQFSTSTYLRLTVRAAGGSLDLPGRAGC